MNYAELTRTVDFVPQGIVYLLEPRPVHEARRSDARSFGILAESTFSDYLSVVVRSQYRSFPWPLSIELSLLSLSR